MQSIIGETKLPVEQVPSSPINSSSSFAFNVNAISFQPSRVCTQCKPSLPTEGKSKKFRTNKVNSDKASKLKHRQGDKVDDSALELAQHAPGNGKRRKDKAMARGSQQRSRASSNCHEQESSEPRHHEERRGVMTKSGINPRASPLEAETPAVVRVTGAPADDFPALSSLSPALSSPSQSTPPAKLQCGAYDFLAVVHKSILLEKSSSQVEPSGGGGAAVTTGWFVSSTQSRNVPQRSRLGETTTGPQVENHHEIPVEATALVDTAPPPPPPPPPPAGSCCINKEEMPHTSYVRPGRLFQCTITDKVREKYRSRWLDIAREATLRAGRARAAAVTRDERGASRPEGCSWHAALTPSSVAVTNRQLTELHAKELVRRNALDESLRAAPGDVTTRSGGAGAGAAEEAGSEEAGSVDCAERWWDRVCAGDVVALQTMMARGFCWTALTCGDDNLTSLHLAAACSHSGVLELLLGGGAAASSALQQTRGSDVDCVDSKRRTPLLVACEVGDLDCVKTLLSYRAALTVRDKTADGPLHKVARGGGRENAYGAYLRTGSDARRKGHLSVLKLLLQKGGSSAQLRLHSRNKQGATPLTLVCARCPEDPGLHHSMVLLLTHAGADPLAINSFGLDALCLVARCGASDIAQHLLFCNNKSNQNQNHNVNHNPNSNKAAIVRKFNPLIEAIKGGFDECARVILASCVQGCSNAADTHRTMLHERGEFAWEGWGGGSGPGPGPGAGADTLISSTSLSRHPRNTSVVTPLIAAVIMNNTSLVQLLLTGGYSSAAKQPLRYSLKAVDDAGFSVLVYACLLGSQECLETILDFEASCKQGESDRDAKSGETLLESVALARTFFLSRGRLTVQPAGEQSQRLSLRQLQQHCASCHHLQSIPRIIARGMGVVTHTFIRRLISSEKYGNVLNETKHLDRSSYFGRSAPSPVVAEAHTKPAKVPQSIIATNSVIDWHHDCLPYPDLILLVSVESHTDDSSSRNHPAQPARSAAAVACHSFILAQHSKCFEKMLVHYREMLRVDPLGAGDEGSTSTSSTHHPDTRQIDMLAQSHRSVEQMLCWMYTGVDVTAAVSIHEQQDEADAAEGSTSSWCVDLQEVVDLLLLANEYLVLRLQVLCEHRIGQLLTCAHASAPDCETHRATASHLRELGEALNLTTLLTYASLWDTPQARRGAKARRCTAESPILVLRARDELGFLDNKNADFPFLLLVVIAHLKCLNMPGNTSVLTYLELFLAMLTSNADNYYSETLDVIDVVVGAFPFMLGGEGSVSAEESSEAVRTVTMDEFGNFHKHNKVQRVLMLQSALMMHFTSAIELAVHVVRLTDDDDSDLITGSVALEMTHRLSNKLYWFFKRHVLLHDMHFEVARRPDGSASEAQIQPGDTRDVLLLFDCYEGGDGGRSEDCGCEALRAHKAVLASGSGKLQALLRLKAHARHSPSERGAAQCYETLRCEHVEPVCLRSLLFLLYCNYQPPVTCAGEGVHLAKLHASRTLLLSSPCSIISPAPPLQTRSADESTALAAPFYMHMADFADEYLVPSQMLREAERELRGLLTTRNAAQVFLVARSVHLPQLACAAAVYFLYGYFDLVKQLSAKESNGETELGASADLLDFLSADMCGSSAGGAGSGAGAGAGAGDLDAKLDAFCLEMLIFMVE